MLQSVFDAPVTVTSIEVLDGDGTSVKRMDGDEVAAATTTPFPGTPTAVVPPGGSLATVLDVLVPPDDVPERLKHRITYELGSSAFTSVIGSTEILAPELDVDPRTPTTIAPPVKGAEWLNANSCCAPQAPHRQFRIAVGGESIKMSEEFAIDWVQMRDGKLFDGDGSRNEDWYTYGVDLVAVADGTVASVINDRPDETPRVPVTAVREPKDYSGNQVSLQISPGVWAIYAHVQPGSITVEPGDQVTKGQVVGKLGNTGNSSGPHLHFQLADGPEILSSNSLPFALDSYRLAGSIDPDQLSAPNEPDGSAPVLTVDGPSGQQADTYPLTYTVTDL